MKFTKYIAYLLIFVIFLNCIILTEEKKSKRNKRKSKNSTAKLKMKIKKLKAQLKVESHILQEMTMKLKYQFCDLINVIACALNGGTKEFKQDKDFSLLELKSKTKTNSDPLLKAMSYGFSIPRRLSYNTKPQNDNFSNIIQCPVGCIVG